MAYDKNTGVFTLTGGKLSDRGTLHIHVFGPSEEHVSRRVYDETIGRRLKQILVHCQATPECHGVIVKVSQESGVATWAREQLKESHAYYRKPLRARAYVPMQHPVVLGLVMPDDVLSTSACQVILEYARDDEKLDMEAFRRVEYREPYDAYTQHFGPCRGNEVYDTVLQFTPEAYATRTFTSFVDMPDLQLGTDLVRALGIAALAMACLCMGSFMGRRNRA